MKAGMITVGMDARLANARRRVGVGNYCLEVLRALAPLAEKEGVRLRVYLDDPPLPGFPELHGAEVCVLPRVRFWTQRALGRELRRRTPDVFLAPALQIPLGCPCPVVATVHDLAYHAFPRHFTRSRLLLARLQSRHAARRADRLIADSKATAADIRRYLRVGDERIAVALLAPGAQYREQVSPDRIDTVRGALGLDAPYILYVGRIQPRKNIKRLISAFERAMERHPESPHSLVIAGGKGWLHEGVFERAKQSPLAERIRFTGYVADEYLPALMKGADALALVSLSEGFGLPVIEAMACGTPVITSNCSSLAEVAGDAGLLVDPTSVENIAVAIGDIISQQELRELLCAKGLIRASAFSWETTARRVLDAALAAAGRSPKHG